MIPLRGAGEIVERLGVADAGRLLLVESPPPFEEILRGALSADQMLSTAEARAIRSVKEQFDWILLWKESRIGSRALFDAAVKRLAPDGRLWIVTVMKKVQGPRTPAAHRLEAGDLVTGLAKQGLARDREARLSAWHVGYRFARTEARATRRKGRTFR